MDQMQYTGHARNSGSWSRHIYGQDWSNATRNDSKLVRPTTVGHDSNSEVCLTCWRSKRNPLWYTLFSNRWHSSRGKTERAVLSFEKWPTPTVLRDAPLRSKRHTNYIDFRICYTYATDFGSSHTYAVNTWLGLTYTVLESNVITQLWRLLYSPLWIWNVTNSNDWILCFGISGTSMMMLLLCWVPTIVCSNYTNASLSLLKYMR